MGEAPHYVHRRYDMKTLLEQQLLKQPLAEIRNILQRDKLTDNIVLNADSYKIGHWMFMEENTTFTSAYFECRVGEIGRAHV